MAEGRVVGIDLGTTNSLVAYMENDTPVVIPGADGSNLVPSVVALDPIPAPIPAGDGRPTVTVGNSARKALIQTPERVIYSVKRLMGRSLEEVQSELKLFPFHLAADPKAGPPIPMKSRAFSWANSALPRRRFRPTFSVSSSATPNGSFLRRSRRRSSPCPPTSTTRSARPPRMPGAWRDLRCCAWSTSQPRPLLPTARSRQGGNHRRLRSGGGTFDISILKLREGIFEVQSTNGDTHLGGDDIDNLLMAIALNEIHAEHGVDLRLHPGAVQAVRKAAIEAKILLSTEMMARFDIELPNGDRYQREIPREVFELLIEPVLARTAGPCKQALADAGIIPEQIDEVVLVGGSTRIPAVRLLVDELFHLRPRAKSRTSN